jgi:methylmalonyl-CoA/ethylmalonyl-CoA epimerase
VIKRIAHIAIVVDDIDAALDFWRDGLGLDLAHVEDVPDQQAAVAFLPTGASEVELVKPTSDLSGIARFLAKRGPGMHHLCFEVDDIEAALDRLRARGVRLINETPTIGTGGKKIAFIHPESTHGVLVELYEMTPEEPWRRLERLRGLSDRVLHQGQVMTTAVREFLESLRRNGDRFWSGEGPEEKNGVPVEPGRHESN